MKYPELVKVVNAIIAAYNLLLTVRQIYYRLISPPYQLFENTRSKYNSFDRMLTKARKRGDVDWTRIEDRSRQFIGEDYDYGYSSIDEYIDAKIQKFKQNRFNMPLWSNQCLFPICVIEKDALATQCDQVASRYNVITYPSKGYSSFTMLKNLVVRFGRNGKKIIILHLSDHDPSGLNMTADLEKRLRAYGLHDFELRRIALTYEQITEYNLGSNPTKPKDTRTKDYRAQFGDRTWELDALDPVVLQQIIEDAIKSCIDADLWNERIEEIENSKQKVDKTLDKLTLVLNKALNEGEPDA